MIPDAGRDVQCSACGHTWMQFSDGHAEEITVPSAAMPPAEDKAVVPEETAEPKPPARRQMDDETRRILKEEAEREAAARRARRRAAETSLETQADLGLDETPEERVTEASADLDTAPSPRTESRSGRLPDIEEINSTLDARPPEQHYGSDAMTITDEADTTGDPGFRGGFVAMILIALLLIAIYLLAPRVAAAVPALEPALSAYVDGANALRQIVNDALQSAADAIGGIAGSPDAGS
ncbi:hypothetical protein PARPLA_00615 [Rhodobacteraceae bacterium THAF1]|nr:hypothetical protein FIU81_14185 [Palleronia sp. THAF1]VDC17275.1 hypothetical protein PARPLA_00615 [Rhodobacteraceae bacterium THAF1]